MKRGYLEAEKGKENFNVMLGGDDSRKKELEETLAGEEYRFVPKGFLGKAVSGSMEMVGQQGSQLFDPLTVGAIGSFAGTAALAGNAGPQALVPEEVVTVPAAALMGWQAGSSMANVKIEAGNAYEEMLEQGVDKDAAKLIASVVGGVNGALEAAQLSSLVKGFDVVKSAGNKGLKDLFIQELKRRELDVLDNVAQEIAQEGTTIAGTQLGSKLSTGQWAYTANEVRDRLGETAVSSALTFGAMNVPGAVGNITWNAQSGKRSVPASGGMFTTKGLENLDTQAGERYDGSKEIELGGLKDGRGEEAGRFDAGVGENDRRHDRETLWYQAKKTDAGGGSKGERDPAFVARVSAEGKTVQGEGQRRYAYRLTAEESYAPVTREAMETAKEWGLTPTVVDSFEWNNGERTFYGMGAVTGRQGQVFLVNGSGKEAVAHEGLHSGLRREIPEAQKFFEQTKQVDLMQEKVGKALRKVSTFYYDKLGRVFDPKKDMPNLNEEFAAYISGMIETGQAEEAFGLTEAENPELFAAWRDFKGAMKANPMSQTDLQGDGPASYSLGAFAGKPKPLVDDAMADNLLRDRSAINFLKRKGGLELTSDMTQAEKRQAVKEAVERVTHHGEGENDTLFSTLNPGEKADTITPQGEESEPSGVLKPGEAEKQQGPKSEAGERVFRPIKDYLGSDGKLDLERVKQDYRKFLQGVPEKNRIYLEQALEAAEFEVSDNPTTIFVYDGKADKILYNPNNAALKYYDMSVVYTHELAHRIDRFFVGTAENERFAKAIEDAGKILDRNPELFVQYCEKNDQEGFCSDILSAVCKDKYTFPVGHDKKYWNAKTQAGEIFANLFSLEACQDKEKIEFLRKYFPELIASFEALEFYIR